MTKINGVNGQRQRHDRYALEPVSHGYRHRMGRRYLGTHGYLGPQFVGRRAIAQVVDPNNYLTLFLGDGQSVPAGAVFIAPVAAFYSPTANALRGALAGRRQGPLHRRHSPTATTARCASLR
jgi:hypothetical protein